jgi:hypothetical protein
MTAGKLFVTGRSIVTAKHDSAKNAAARAEMRFLDW